MAVADCGKIPLQTSWIEIRNTSELNSFFRGLCSITFPPIIIQIVWIVFV